MGRLKRFEINVLGRRPAAFGRRSTVSGERGERAARYSVTSEVTGQSHRQSQRPSRRQTSVSCEVDLEITAGTTVWFRVFVDAYRAIWMRDMTVNFYGYADVHWSESNEEGRMINFRNHENYFHNTKVIYHPESGGHLTDDELVILPGGHHCFDVSFELPSDCPSSFEGDHGRIKYGASCVMDLPDDDNEMCEVPVTVLGIDNISHFRGMSADDECEKMFSGRCCTTHPVTVTARLHQTSYTPGDSINISAVVVNKTSNKIPETSATLYQLISYHSLQGRTHQTKKIVSSVQPGGLGARTCTTWRDVYLSLPVGTACQLRGCFIIDILYHIEVTAVVLAKRPCDLSVHLPINVGRVAPRDSLRRATLWSCGEGGEGGEGGGEREEREEREMEDVSETFSTMSASLFNTDTSTFLPTQPRSSRDAVLLSDEERDQPSVMEQYVSPVWNAFTWVYNLLYGMP